MWEIIQFTSKSGFVIGKNNGVSIELHQGLTGAYTTPYHIEAQQIADELNKKDAHQVANAEDAIPTISSREIATLTGKQHFHIKRDIEAMFSDGDLGGSAFASTYLDVSNRQQTEYLIPVAMAKERFLSTVNQHRVHGEREGGALCAIERLLSIKLARQFIIGKYRIDGYCVETNTAYEIDEEQHFVKGELKQACKNRQAYIESVLGCTFVRIAV